MNATADMAGRLERIFLAGVDAQAALRGLDAALAARGLRDAELRAAYLESLEGHLERIMTTATGAVERPTEETSCS